MANPFVSVINLGCRVNRVESDRMERDLSQAGFALVDPDEAELIVINTCAVTGEAEAKTRKAVRHALGRAREPFVVATGCAASLHPEALRDLSDRVTVVPSKVEVVSRALKLLGLEESVRGDGEPCEPAFRQARVGVKVQDGCNNRCTYCIVWKARGPERSVPVDAVLEQVRDVEEAGLPEVVLTGVNLGAYDGSSANDEHVEIDELLGIILRETSIPQIRLSSIEPMDVSDRLIDRIAESRGRIAPFLHLPVQSGCTATLERMGRPYRAEEFEDLCDRIRRKVPAGTPAATMPDQVPPEIMAERSQRMRELAERMARIDAQSRCGTCERAVIEQGRRGTLASFHRVEVDGLDREGIEAPALVDVAIMDVNASGLVKAEFVRRSVLGNASVASKGD